MLARGINPIWCPQAANSQDDAWWWGAVGQPNSGFLSTGVADVSSAIKVDIACDCKFVVDDIKEGRGGTYAAIVSIYFWWESSEQWSS